MRHPLAPDIRNGHVPASAVNRVLDTRTSGPALSDFARATGLEYAGHLADSFRDAMDTLLHQTGVTLESVAALSEALRSLGQPDTGQAVSRHPDTPSGQLLSYALGQLGGQVPGQRTTA